MTAILPDNGVEIAAHPSAGVVIEIVAVSAGAKLWKSPIAAPNAVPGGRPKLESGVTVIPMKWGSVLAPAVIAFAALPGDSTVIVPGPELPAAIAATTPASTAALIASDNRSWGPWTPPPRLRLKTIGVPKGRPLKYGPRCTTAPGARQLAMNGCESRMPVSTTPTLIAARFP